MNINEIITSEKSFIISLYEDNEVKNKIIKTVEDVNYNSIVLNLLDLDSSVSWNPLEYPYYLYKTGDKNKAIHAIADVSNPIFYMGIANDEFQHNATNLFACIALDIFESSKPEEININSIYRVFENKELLEKCIANNFEIVHSYLGNNQTADLSQMPTDFFAIAKQDVKLLITRDKLNNLLMKTTFDLNTIRTNPTAVIIIDRKDSYLNIISKMFKNQLNSVLIDSNKEKFMMLEIGDNVDKYRDEIKDEVDQEMINQGLMIVENGEKIPMFGSAKARWEIEKRILKERYNIDWKSPADEHPEMKFD